MTNMTDNGKINNDELQNVSEHEEQEDDVERVFIEDEEGNTHEYEVIMYLQPDGSEHQYVILLQVDGENEEDEDELEVVPFRYTEEGDELKLFPLESEEEWQIVTETFHALYNAEEDEEDDQPNHKD
jgi:hypothetical protein